MTTQYWLVKSEPATYAWADLVRENRTAWTGVRNYAARNNLRTMRLGDRVLFYESGMTKAVVGIAQVARTAFPDPTADDPAWGAVELRPVRAFLRRVTLGLIKAEPALAKSALLRLSRLSVQSLTSAEFARISKLGGA
jgi:predicted RNA-binding protein with PUA-like domain